MKFPIGGKPRARSGAIPEATVKVWMKEFKIFYRHFPEVFYLKPLFLRQREETKNEN